MATAEQTAKAASRDRTAPSAAAGRIPLPSGGHRVRTAAIRLGERLYAPDSVYLGTDGGDRRSDEGFSLWIAAFPPRGRLHSSESGYPSSKSRGIPWIPAFRSIEPQYDADSCSPRALGRGLRAIEVTERVQPLSRCATRIPAAHSRPPARSWVASGGSGLVARTERPLPLGIPPRNPNFALDAKPEYDSPARRVGERNGPAAPSHHPSPLVMESNPTPRTARRDKITTVESA